MLKEPKNRFKIEEISKNLQWKKEQRNSGQPENLFQYAASASKVFFFCNMCTLYCHFFQYIFFEIENSKPYSWHLSNLSALLSLNESWNYAKRSGCFRLAPFLSEYYHYINMWWNETKYLKWSFQPGIISVSFQSWKVHTQQRCFV